MVVTLIYCPHYWLKSVWRIIFRINLWGDGTFLYPLTGGYRDVYTCPFLELYTPLPNFTVIIFKNLVTKNIG